MPHPSTHAAAAAWPRSAGARASRPAWLRRIVLGPLAAGIAVLILVAGAQHVPSFAGQKAPQAVFYVAPTGSDTNPGTVKAPFGTLEHARATVAALTPTMTGDIKVVLRGGTYRLTAPLVLGPGDSGTGGHRVSYEAYNAEKPVLSGGVEITGWTREDPVRNRWKAPVPAGLRTRELYVNGVRADRSRLRYGLPLTNQTAPTLPATIQRTATGFVTSNTSIRQWRNPQLIEFVWSGLGANANAGWIEPRCRVRSFSGTATSTTITMRSPCIDLLRPELKKDQTALLPSYVENVFEATQQPGQFYLDEPANTMYYVPRGGEDITTARVVAPTLEQLVVLRGTPEQPVHDVSFAGLTFGHTTWLQPNSDGGYPERQATIYAEGPTAGSVAPPGTVSVTAGHNIDFTGNVFTHLGAAGLEMRGGVQHSQIIGNAFLDISGNAVQVGGFLVKQPEDAAKDRNITIANNYINGAGAAYRGGVGIFAGYVADTTIAHNEVSNTSYTGISLGWGWAANVHNEGNRVEANNIHHVVRATPEFHDGGGIYTLGSSPDGDRSTITRNWIHDLPYVFGAIYLDAGSGRFDVTENVVSESQARNWFFLALVGSPPGTDNVFRGNYTSHTSYQSQANIGSNTVADNQYGLTAWPKEAQKIMREAGLEPPYRGLLRTPVLS